MDELAFSFLLALVSVLAAATVALITRHRERANVSTALAGVESARKVKPWPRYALKEAILVSHNTKLFRFSLPSPNDSLDLPPGRHVMLRATVNGERVVRPYTPTSHPRQPGHFDLVIKTYALGKMSQYLHGLSPGDTVEVKGPVGRLKYEANADDLVLMLAAGSGITPMLQLMRHGVEDCGDDTRFALFFQNREERDVLLRRDLDALVQQAPDQASVCYVLSKAPPGWDARGRGRHIAGYVSRRHLDAAIGDADPGRVRALVCGPGGFNDAMVELCRELGVRVDVL